MIYIFEVSCLKAWKGENISVDNAKNMFKEINKIANDWIWSYTFPLICGAVATITFKLSSNEYVWFIECAVALLNGYFLVCMLSYLDYNSRNP